MSTILASVAHSATSPGAQNPDEYASEYLISQRATIAFWRALGGEHEVELYDAGPLTAREYDDAKIACVNACKPKLALEMHCNASDNRKARYGEVIYREGSAVGKDAAHAVMASLERRIGGMKIDWVARGARANSVAQDGHSFFFLERTTCPAIIVEGFFISNTEHARWLVQGGQDLYGIMVADGIKEWLR